MAGDTFIIIQEVAASIKNELSPVNLDALHVMRGMSEHKIHASSLQQFSGEATLFRGDAKTPVRPPVNRDYDEIAVVPVNIHVVCDHIDGAIG